MLEVYGGGGCGVLGQDGSVLFDLVDAAAGADLGKCISTMDFGVGAPQHTTPISSYNMADMCW